MLNYKQPLNAQEAAFAAEHHAIVYKFLNKRRLPEDEFYDIAVFGYLRAVRKYLARPELRQYQFSTIAFRAMSCDVHHSKEYWTRSKRFAEVEQYQEDIHTSELCDSVSGECELTESYQELVRQLAPMQHRIARLRCDGYQDKEIACMCGLELRDVEHEMAQARAKLLNFPMKTAAAAA